MFPVKIRVAYILKYTNVYTQFFKFKWTEKVIVIAIIQTRVFTLKYSKATH